jgi:hypothetical protein
VVDDLAVIRASAHHRGFPLRLRGRERDGTITEERITCAADLEGFAARYRRRTRWRVVRGAKTAPQERRTDP